MSSSKETTTKIRRKKLFWKPFYIIGRSAQNKDFHIKNGSDNKYGLRD